MDLRALLASALPEQQIEALARRSGVLRRRRKVDPMAWLWTLVLGFGTGRVRTLAGLRRGYERAPHSSLVPSGLLRPIYGGHRSLPARSGRRVVR